MDARVLVVQCRKDSVVVYERRGLLVDPVGGRSPRLS